MPYSPFWTTNLCNSFMESLLYLVRVVPKAITKNDMS